jgi:filamentous hemagglutinin family protein
MSTTHGRHRPRLLTRLTAAGTCLFAGATTGQVITDGTAGPAQILSGSRIQIPSELGSRAGANLFHSFASFNVSAGQFVAFTGSADIDNVIARVTGAEVSVIDGRLAVLIPRANFWLLNPSGVIFGENARLDIPGQLAVSTGSELHFADGSNFSARLEGLSLSAAPPADFGLLGAPMNGSIRVAGSVSALRGIQMQARDIDVVPGGSITMTPQGTSGPLRLFASNAIELRESPDTASARGTVGTISAGPGEPGEVRLEAPLIRLLDGASIGTGAAAGAAASAPVYIVASDTLEMRGGEGGLFTPGSRITMSTETAAGGDLFIRASNVLMSEFSEIRSTTAGTGDGGSLRLETDSLTLATGSQIGSFALNQESEGGNGGSIDISATQDVLLDGRLEGQVATSGFGASIVTSTASSGRGGDITITAPTITLANGGRIEAGNYGPGPAGTVTVTADESIVVAGTGSIFGSVIGSVTDGAGRGGDTTIIAPVVRVENGGSIQVDNTSTGRSGDLVIQAPERLLVAGSGPALDPAALEAWRELLLPLQELDPTLLQGNSARFLGASGDGLEFISNISADSIDGIPGRIDITAGTVDLRDAGNISARTGGDAPGGAIFLQAQQLRIDGEGSELTGVFTDASALESDSDQRISGVAGNITIEVEELLLREGIISSTGTDDGAGGTVDLRIARRLNAIDSTIATRADSANGGDTNLRLGSSAVAVVTDSEISSSVGEGDGSGGNVSVVPDTDTQRRRGALVILDNTRMSARADRGQGGNLLLRTDVLIASDDTQFDVSSRANLDGRVEIVTQDTNTDPVSDTSPPDYLTNAIESLACSRSATGSLTSALAGRDGSRQSPEDALLALSAHTSADASGTEGFLDELHRLRVMLERDPRAVDSVNSALVATRASMETSDLDQADAFATRAIRLQRNADTLASKSLVDHAQGEFSTAARGFEQAARRALGTGDVEFAARALANAARTWNSAKETARALDTLRRARELARELPTSEARALISLHLSGTWVRLLRSDGAAAGPAMLEALSQLREAEALTRVLPAQSPQRSYAYGYLGALYALDRQHDAAEKFTWRAIDVAQAANAPRAEYRWHRQRALLLDASGDSDGAIVAYENALALTRRLATSAAAGQLREARFKQEVAPVYLELVELLLAKADAAGTQNDQLAHLQAARAVANELHSAEFRDYFRDDCHMAQQTRALSTTDPSAQVPAGTALVFPIVLGDRIEILVQTETELRRFTSAIDATTLSQLVRRFRQELSRPGSTAYAGDARALYDLLLRPAQGMLAYGKIDRLWFVPDAMLRQVPLAALHDGDAFLVERFAVAVLPSVSSAGSGPPARRTPRVLLAGAAEFTPPRPPLGHVAAEIDAIQSAWPAASTTLFAQRFSSERMRQALAVDEPSVMHVATHATFTGSPYTSYLVAANDEALFMGELEADLLALRARGRPVDLLVLSACETAAASVRSAIGLAGLGLRAGARHAVGSLWQVADEATATLFARFYRELAASGVGDARGLDPTPALRAAQVSLLAEKRFAHPFYWAAFQVMSADWPFTGSHVDSDQGRAIENAPLATHAISAQ